MFFSCSGDEVALGSTTGTAKLVDEVEEVEALEKVG